MFSNNRQKYIEVGQSFLILQDQKQNVLPENQKKKEGKKKKKTNIYLVWHVKWIMWVYFCRIYLDQVCLMCWELTHLFLRAVLYSRVDLATKSCDIMPGLCSYTNCGTTMSRQFNLNNNSETTETSQVRGPFFFSSWSRLWKLNSTTLSVQMFLI